MELEEAVEVQYVDVPGGEWVKGVPYRHAVRSVYEVEGDPGRRCQVATGVLPFPSHPSGPVMNFSGRAEVRVVGGGALYFRVVDGGGPCRIAVQHLGDAGATVQGGL